MPVFKRPVTAKVRATAATAFAVVAAVATATAIPVEASAAGCRPTPNLLSRKPSVVALAGGASARVWDTGPTPTNPQASTRIVAVTIPAGNPKLPRVLGASSLTSAKTPSQYWGTSAGPVAMVNGGVFNPTRGALPDLPQMTKGRVTKARSVHDPVIAVDRSGRTSPSRLWITGTVKSASGGSKAMTGLNWQSVTGSGINVYTTSWGSQRRPYGTVDVVLVGGKVAAVRRGTARGAAPTKGQVILTATGASGTWLSGLRTGTTVWVSYQPHTDAPHGLYEAVGRGARFLNKGVVNGGACASRDELLRPRTAVGWTAGGDLMLVTVSGRATVDGVRFGGATIHQMADYMARLGAWDATNLDGGGSTTLLVRTPKGTVTRLDRANSEAQRKVPNAFSVG